MDGVVKTMFVIYDLELVGNMHSTCSNIQFVKSDISYRFLKMKINKVVKAYRPTTITTPLFSKSHSRSLRRTQVCFHGIIRLNKQQIIQMNHNESSRTFKRR